MHIEGQSESSEISVDQLDIKCDGHVAVRSDPSEISNQDKSASEWGVFSIMAIGAGSNQGKAPLVGRVCRHI